MVSAKCSSEQDQKLIKGALKMALKPLHDRVLVRRVESDEKTAGGLIIPLVQRETR